MAFRPYNVYGSISILQNMPACILPMKEVTEERRHCCWCEILRASIEPIWLDYDGYSLINETVPDSQGILHRWSMYQTKVYA